MTATLATIRDRDAREVARVEACAEGQDVAIRIIHGSDSCRKMLREIDDDKLCFMINGRIYHEVLQVGGKRFLPLDELITKLTNDQLQLEYDSVGVERGHELKRQVAKQQRDYVPFTELLDILRNSSQAS
jgi:hypothetical protein